MPGVKPGWLAEFLGDKKVQGRTFTTRGRWQREDLGINREWNHDWNNDFFLFAVVLGETVPTVVWMCVGVIFKQDLVDGLIC